MVKESISHRSQILFVEDNEDDFVLAAEYLPASRFELHHAPSAQSAINCMRGARYDLILLDHNLPDTNSLAFLARIREEHPGMPVIVLTGHDSQSLAVSALKQGAANFLIKDEMSEHLLDVVERAVAPAASPPAQQARFVDNATAIYEAVLETMAEACLVISSDGVITFVNRALAQLTGRSTSALLGETGITLFEDPTARQITALLNSAPDESAGKFEGALFTAAGEPAPVLISLRRLSRLHAGQDGHLLVLTPIAELVQARQQMGRLIDSEKSRNLKLQAVHRIMTTAAQLEADAVMSRACRLIGQIFGYDRVQVGRVQEDAIAIEQRHIYRRRQLNDHGVDPDVIPRHLTSVMTTAVNEKRTVHVRDTLAHPLFLKKPGSQTRSEIAFPIMAGRQPVAVLDVQSAQVSSFTDDDILLLQLLAEWLGQALQNATLYEAVAAEQQRLGALINSSEEGILFIDTEARLRVINPRALELLGIGGEAAVWENRPVLRLLQQIRHHVPPNIYQELENQIREILDESRPLSTGKARIGPRFLRWNTVTVLREDQKVGWLMVIHDETQRYEVEELRQDLTRTLIHDLRNPLTGILNAMEFLEMLDESGTALLQDRQRQYVELALKNTYGLLTLVNDILEASRIESGMSSPSPAPLELAPLIEDAFLAQEAVADRKKIHLHASLPEPLPPVLADAELLRRVLQNLLDNAIKFSLPGGAVTVSASWPDAARMADQRSASQLLVTVQDNGIGIPTDVQNRLFNKFSAGNHRDSGSGLGLSFCRQAVTAMDGRIWLESAPDRGTTVFFTLPTPTEVRPSQ